MFDKMVFDPLLCNWIIKPQFYLSISVITLSQIGLQKRTQYKKPDRSVSHENAFLCITAANTALQTTPIPSSIGPSHVKHPFKNFIKMLQ